MKAATLASRMDCIQPSPTLAITAKAKKLQSEGVDIVSFGAGEPDFNTPDPICEAAIKAIRDGETKYGPSAGLPKLREAIADKLQRENRLSYSPDQIVVSCGAKHSIYNAMQVLVNPGDEVVLIAPYWMTYFEQVRLAGGIPKVVHTTAESGFSPTLEQLREAVTSKTSAIVLNSPSNPTGAMLSRDTMKQIAALALSHGFWIITDEIYERLTYGEQHVSIAGLGREVCEQTVTVSGCSKTYSMTGWRVGYAAAPGQVAKAMAALQDQMTSNATSFAQFGAIAALQLPEEVVEAMRQEFEQRRDLICERLNKIHGVRCALPDGAFYAFADFSGALRDGETDMDLAGSLLDDAHVAVIPGSVFEGRGHLRFSYATSRIEIGRGMERVEKFLAKRSA